MDVANVTVRRTADWEAVKKERDVQRREGWETSETN